MLGKAKKSDQRNVLTRKEALSIQHSAFSQTIFTSEVAESEEEDGIRTIQLCIASPTNTRYFADMRRALLFLLICVFTFSQAKPGGISKRNIPCKIPANASSCYWTHGRLIAGNGNPSFRLWKIGTHRVLGIYSGPSVDRYNSLDNEYPELPASLSKNYHPFENTVFADFEVCPLEPERAGYMQAACVESAKNIVMKK